MPGAMDTSYLSTQVTTIIGQLHSIFDEIGVPRNERESRETEVEWPNVLPRIVADMIAAIRSFVGDIAQPTSSSQFVSLCSNVRLFAAFLN